jgi:hypothetical protein
MKIGIDINGVLRDTVGKFKLVYEKFLMKNEYNLDEEDPFEYEIVEPIDTIDLKNHFKFPSDEDFFSFVYEESPMEIFGHAPSTEMMTFNILNELYVSIRDNHDLIIISDEIGKTKPATLFFLSKFGCLAESIVFFNEVNKNKVLEQFDLIVTSNPNILINYSNCIKFNTDYNKNIKCDNSIDSIQELDTTLKKLINA